MCFSRAVPGLAVLALILALAGASARAETAIDCGYPLSDEERAFCADKALEDARTEMRETLAQLAERVAALDADLPEHLKGSGEALDAAQAAWEAYADADCKAYAFPFMGGPPGPDLYRNCMIVLTRRRTDDLTGTIEDYSN